MSIFEQLLNLLPILSQLEGKNVKLVTELIQIAEAEIKRRMKEQKLTRAQVLDDAAITWGAAIKGADDLAKLGHGDES